MSDNISLDGYVKLAECQLHQKQVPVGTEIVVQRSIYTGGTNYLIETTKVKYENFRLGNGSDPSRLFFRHLDSDTLDSVQVHNTRVYAPKDSLQPINGTQPTNS